MDKGKIELAEIVRRMKAKMNSLSQSSPKQTHIEGKASEVEDPNLSMGSESEAEAEGYFLEQAVEQRQSSIKKPLNKQTAFTKPVLKQQKKSKPSKSVRIEEERNQVHTVPVDKSRRASKPKQQRLEFDHQLRLLNAIQTFLQHEDLTFDEFKSALSAIESANFRQEKVMPLLEKTLPEYGVDVSFRFLRKNIDEFNQTPWTQADIDTLMQLVIRFGRKWKRIGAQMGRGRADVFQRYQAVSRKGVYEQLDNLWKFSELVLLVTELARQTQVSFVNTDIVQELDRADQHDKIEQEQFLSPKNRSLTTHHNMGILTKFIDVALLNTINLNKDASWDKISATLSSKQPSECKKKVVEIAQSSFQSRESLDEELSKFLMRQQPSSQSGIDWNKWKSATFSVEDASNRLGVLTKLICGRSHKSFPFILQQIYQRTQQYSQ